MDRGYESFNNIAHLQEKKWNFIIRAKESYGMISNLQLRFTSQKSYTLIWELLLYCQIGNSFPSGFWCLDIKTSLFSVEYHGLQFFL